MIVISGNIPIRNRTKLGYSWDTHGYYLVVIIILCSAWNSQHAGRTRRFCALRIPSVASRCYTNPGLDSAPKGGEKAITPPWRRQRSLTAIVRNNSTFSSAFGWLRCRLRCETRRGTGPYLVFWPAWRGVRTTLYNYDAIPRTQVRGSGEVCWGLVQNVQAVRKVLSLGLGWLVYSLELDSINLQNLLKWVRADADA